MDKWEAIKCFIKLSNSAVEGLKFEVQMGYVYNFNSTQFGKCLV